MAINRKILIIIGCLCIVIFSHSVLADFHLTNFGGSVTVEAPDYAPHINHPASYTNTTGVSISTSQWNVTITDDGNQFNYTMETSPDIGDAMGENQTNGSKILSLSGLTYNTNYTIYVNATDGPLEVLGLGGWNNQTYWFETEEAPTFHSASFGGTVTVQQSIVAEVKPVTWSIGSISCGIDVQNNFTFWQNGSTPLDVYVNVTPDNLSFVTYPTWDGNGQDQYCGNITNDSWVTEENINGWTLFASDFTGEKEFGVRLWMPKSLSTGVHESFVLHVYYTEHT